MNLGIAAAFAAGLVSVASPCVLPLVPSYLSHLAGAEVADLRRGAHPRALARAGLFVAGFAAVFVVLGASAGLAGAALARYQPFLEKISGLAVIVFGLQLLGVWTPAWPNGGVRAGSPAGPRSSLALGAAFAVCWTPCVGPVLASLLVLAGQTATVSRGVALLAAYSAGMGLPFLVAALWLRWFLQASTAIRRWLPVVERCSGALLVVVGLILYFGAYGRLAGLLAA